MKTTKTTTEDMKKKAESSCIRNITKNGKRISFIKQPKEKPKMPPKSEDTQREK